MPVATPASVYAPFAATLAVAPPIEMITASPLARPATVPVSVLPPTTPQNVSVPAVTSACVRYCTVTAVAPLADCVVYAIPPLLWLMVNRYTSPTLVTCVQPLVPFWNASQIGLFAAAQVEKSTTTLPVPPDADTVTPTVVV